MEFRNDIYYIKEILNGNQNAFSLEEFPADATDFMGVSTNEAGQDEEYMSSLVNFAMQKISEEERGLIGLYYYEELTTEEIAEVTGISRSNVKTKLFRARKKIIEIIKKVEKKNFVYHE